MTVITNGIQQIFYYNHIIFIMEMLPWDTLIIKTVNEQDICLSSELFTLSELFEEPAIINQQHLWRRRLF